MNEVKAESPSSLHEIVNICLHIHYKVTGLQSLDKLYQTRFLLKTRLTMYHENKFNRTTIYSTKLNYLILSFG